MISKNIFLSFCCDFLTNPHHDIETVIEMNISIPSSYMRNIALNDGSEDWEFLPIML
jgi:hypothetical protein